MDDATATSAAGDKGAGREALTLKLLLLGSESES